MCPQGPKYPFCNTNQDSETWKIQNHTSLFISIWYAATFVLSKHRTIQTEQINTQPRNWKHSSEYLFLFFGVENLEIETVFEY